MRMVIDIPDDTTKLIKECIKFDNMVDLDVYDVVLNGIKNGTPLPKGHGKLKNEEINKIKYSVCCPMCDNKKCVKGTDKCEAEVWAKAKKEVEDADCN